ncbi:MAG: ShlB/FhaC/HecB family hemolysin secretion/activation protein, partial [Pseudomonas sp.]|nr:ShlB/FhaC/HecB family hemolysin secretion/activation protein [Pseudomonas sp.]
MRNCVPFLLLALAPYAGAETLPRFLNSNDSMQTLPTPNLPVDAYRPAAPALELPKPAAAQPRPLEMGTRLTIRKLQIEGGTIYPLPELGAVYKPLLGHEITLAELIEATRKITKRYQDDGYLLSYAFLPQQNFDQGLVRVVLVEGYISEYKVDGDIGRVKGFVDELVDKLKGERPLTRKTFNRYSTLLSRIPGVTLEAQVPPPGTTDGASTLSISASRKPFTTSMSLVEGNRSSTQALLAASSNSQTAMAEQLTLSGLFPPGNDKEHYYRLDYSQYLNAEGTQLNLFGSSYRSDPSTSIVTSDGFELKPHRENDRFSIGISHPL